VPDYGDHPYTPECPHCQLQRQLDGLGPDDVRSPTLPPVGSRPFALGEEAVLAHRYRIEEQLSMGAAGVVYRAVDQHNNHEVAVKVLQWWDDDPTTLRRFRREANIVRRLAHPHIVRMLDFGQTTDGICYIVLELLPGEPLNVLVRREGQLDITPTVQIAARCASALTAVHAENIVHRDLKPMNIFINHYPDDPEVKLLDFGMSKLLEDASTVTDNNSVLGSVSYMSPEQARGQSKSVDHRADVYGLAGVIYRMLAGRPPFEAESLAKLSAAVIRVMPQPPSQFRYLPKEIDRVLLKALSKKREDRHDSVRDLYEQVRDALA
jgi:serine/threonine protein kinase